MLRLLNNNIIKKKLLNINKNNTNILIKNFSTNIKNNKNKIGFIGLGRMGSGMAYNMANDGYELLVYDVNEDNINNLVKKHDNIEGSNNISNILNNVDTVISMLPNDKILKQVINSDEYINSLQDNTVHISCSTVSPHTSREMDELHNNKNSIFISSPVFARPDGIETKAAFFMLSGKKDGIKRAKPIIETTAAKIFEFGDDPGAANVAKLSGNYLIATAIEGIGESLQMAENNGVNRVDIMNMLSSTIFDCIIYKGYGQRVSERDHRPGGFALELGHKDVSLVMDTAHLSNTPMPFGSILRDRFISAKAQGWNDLDWSAIGLGISHDAGIDVKDAVDRSRNNKPPKL